MSVSTPPKEHLHSHASQAPGHDGHHHDHSHHTHSHADALVPARPAVPAFSLLTISAGQRLLGALALSGLLWLAVWWALQ